ncbi:MAG: hypothetical protein JWN12_433 [Candidatus Saccharibacteria bacterium]|nr:hypothetical protein [Candidatus Saccharibacteria bacterium]
MDRLIRDGHKVKIITARYPGATGYELCDGAEYYRIGNRYTVYLKARQLFKSKLKNWADVIIDEMNTLPFGVAYYTSTRTILLNYQLAREVWFYQMPFPISLVGYLFEPFMLRSMAKKYPLVATESLSTKKDLNKYSFKDVRTFRVGIALNPLEELPIKLNPSTVLSLGAIRPMKRTLDAVKSFEVAKSKMPALQMIIAGSDGGKYATEVKKYIAQSPYSDSIIVMGRVTPEKRIELMKDAAVILVTSIKEGWGLIVTEAASQGTPAIVYDTDGLRDSVRHNITGIVSKNNDYKVMGNEIFNLLKDNTKYNLMRLNGWQWSKEFTFENSYGDFLKVINNK